MSCRVDDLPARVSFARSAVRWTPQACVLFDAPARRRLVAVANGIVDAGNRLDLDAVLAYQADDAVLMPPGESPVVGKISIRLRYETREELLTLPGIGPSARASSARAASTSPSSAVQWQVCWTTVPVEP
jgi:hypothetical protein